MSKQVSRVMGRNAAAAVSIVCGITVVMAIGCDASDPEPDQVSSQHKSEVLRVSAETAQLLLSLSPPPRLMSDPTNQFFSDARAAHFGQFLFFDTALSGNSTMSCATCHQPERTFTDGRPVAEAAAVGKRNTPTILNAAHFPWLNWDGSADTLWMQAARPFEATHELDSTRVSIARLIGITQDRRSAYERIFSPLPPAARFEKMPERASPAAPLGSPDRIAWDAMSELDQILATEIFINICKAIAAYQSKLLSHDAPFDRFVNAVATHDLQQWAADGNPGFGVQELAGLELFSGKADCIACHAGPLFSDFAFHSVRVAPTDGTPAVDSGRFGGLASLLSSSFNAAGPHSDNQSSQAANRLAYMTNPGSNWGRFRTPSLRNVTQTGPYMHAGQFDDLDRVLQHYSTFENALPPDHHDMQEQLLRPLHLTDDEKAAIMAFLGTLTDIHTSAGLLTKPESPIYPPDLAKSGQ